MISYHMHTHVSTVLLSNIIRRAGSAVASRDAGRAIWLRTNGVNTNGAAAKAFNFDRSGKKIRPGTPGNIKTGSREYPKSPLSKNIKIAVAPLLTPFVPFRSSYITITITVMATTSSIFVYITITITITTTVTITTFPSNVLLLLLLLLLRITITPFVPFHYILAIFYPPLKYIWGCVWLFLQAQEGNIYFTE